MRRCANPVCDRTLNGLRADAKWCSDACRKAAARAGLEAGFDPRASDALWTGIATAKSRRRPDTRRTQTTQRPEVHA
jgi:hypothetical protein